MSEFKERNSMTFNRRRITKKPGKPSHSPYRSGFEKKAATYLKEMGVPFKYEEDKIKYVQPATDKTYLPDFKLPNGIYVETKGRFTAQDRKKMVLVISQNPDKDIRILFERNNTLTKTSRTTYGMWCDKKGIEWAVSKHGHTPESWIREKPRVLSETEKTKGFE